MKWTQEKDIELISSFMGDMHNWFVFCRKNKVDINNTIARTQILETQDNYEELRSKARDLFNLRNEKREHNSKKLQNIFDKGAPASVEDIKWLEVNEW